MWWPVVEAMFDVCSMCFRNQTNTQHRLSREPITLWRRRWGNIESNIQQQLHRQTCFRQLLHFTVAPSSSFVYYRQTPWALREELCYACVYSTYATHMNVHWFWWSVCVLYSKSERRISDISRLVFELYLSRGWTRWITFLYLQSRTEIIVHETPSCEIKIRKTKRKRLGWCFLKVSSRCGWDGLWFRTESALSP